MTTNDALPHGSTRITGQPLDSDIICGRGRCVQHPGNQNLRRLVNARKAEYQACTRRTTKTKISKGILSELGEARFLMFSHDAWNILPATYAREKIAHALRSQPRSSRPPPKRATPPKRSPAAIALPERVTTKIQTILTHQQSILRDLLRNSDYGKYQVPPHART